MTNLIAVPKREPKWMKAQQKRVAAGAAREAESLRSLAKRPTDGGRSSGQGMDGAPPAPKPDPVPGAN